MYRKVILLTVGLVCVTAIPITYAANADSRWADYKNWTKLNAKPITGDHTGVLGKLHRGSDGVRFVYVNDIGAAASQAW